MMVISSEKEDFRSAQQIPVYQRALELGKMVNEFTRKIYEAKQGGPEVDLLHRSASLIAPKIAGGHCLGYSEEFLGKNIRLCREALKACSECERLLTEVLGRSFAALNTLSLQETTRQVFDEITAWIKDLESRQ
ncbi:MAG: hypothetical protein V2A65_06525 [Candidatus Omnitrophota bacterium]